KQTRPTGGILLICLPQAGDSNTAHQSSSTISPARLRNNRSPSTQNNTATTATGAKRIQSGHKPCIRISWHAATSVAIGLKRIKDWRLSGKIVTGYTMGVDQNQKLRNIPKN